MFCLTTSRGDWPLANGRKEMFYLKTHSANLIYGSVALDTIYGRGPFRERKGKSAAATTLTILSDYRQGTPELATLNNKQTKTQEIKQKKKTTNKQIQTTKQTTATAWKKRIEKYNSQWGLSWRRNLWFLQFVGNKWFIDKVSFPFFHTLCVWVQREIERQTDRHTDRQTHRQTYTYIHIYLGVSVCVCVLACCGFRNTHEHANTHTIIIYMCHFASHLSLGYNVNLALRNT